MADNQPLFLKNLWYFAMHGASLKRGKLIQKQLLGEKIVFGRDADGNPFALKDNCPHRGVPLSYGWFDGKTITCCYHGWQFDCTGTCQKVPALAEEKMDVRKIKVYQYPCKEVNGTIWIYFPQNKLQTSDAAEKVPDLLLDPARKFLHVETVVIPTNIDHSVIGLIDPAHVTFVHQSWFWRSAKNLKRKEKRFEPVDAGFKMARHKPSSNSKGYSVLKGGTSTEINFQLPGNRLEHIQVGAKHEIISITTLTPIDENNTELNHIFYTTLGLVRFLWWPLKSLGKTFIGQDLHVFQKLREGLDTNPTLMLLGDPDTQAKWYYELKKQWHHAQETKTEFVNPLQTQTLYWVT
jgi:phenylpropionate dioxygenase-like ring-hydroxylating dioxygenase large terminal subunit